ncbi:MAG: RimK family alpha-L-glutamate ligase [Methylophilaceae bacterium]|jgi:glutathione synthase/RimK-type ligase-like ATP-grasp enzyme
MIKIPVFTDDPGWHGKRLKEAFALRGYEAIFVSIKNCFLNLTSDSTGVVIPGFDVLPQFVFVRGVPGGTLQQVIARLDVLHALEMLGVKVYNSGRAIERTVDKAMTSLVLHQNKISTPDTWICESRHHAQVIIAREISNDNPLVIKPLFGSQGNGVRLLQLGDKLPVPMEAYVDGLYYLQRYIDSGEGVWHDYRVFVIRGKAIAAMLRHGSSWVNNVALGAQCEAVSPEGELGALAEAAAVAIDIDYCGVDIIRDRHGKLFVLEINSIPAWKGLQSVLEIDVAQALVDDCLVKLT